ncbi:MAG: DEAD/DEAH box helicase [Myxococcota bacterium]
MSDLDLDLAALSRQFDSTTWERGLELAREGAVQSCAEADGMRGWYTAKVGTNRVETVEFQLGRTVVHGQCTCDVRYDCQHLAAALHTLADPNLTVEVEARKVMHELLGLLEHPPEPSPPRILPRLPAPVLPEASDREVRYLISLAESPEGALRLRIQPRVGPKAGRGKPRVARLVVGSAQSVVPAGVQHDDLDLWHTLRVASPRDDESLPTTPGSAAMLRRFLETGRARWQHWDGPTLRWSDDVTDACSVRWHPKPDASQRLMLEVDAPARIVVPCEPPVFLDTEDGTVGDAPNPLPAALRRTLFDAPSLSVEVAYESTFLERLTALALPLPLHGSVVRPEVEVTPTLHLHTDDAGPHATVGLRYGPVGVPLHGGGSELSHWDGATLQIMRRDRESEREALAMLRELGLPDPDEQGRLLLDADGWLGLLDLVPVLESRGWSRSGTPPEAVAPVEPSAWYLDVDDDEGEPGGGWFSFELGVDIDGPEGIKRVNLLPVLLRAIDDGRLQHDRIVVGASITLRLDDGSLLRVDAEKVQRILDGLVAMSTSSRGPNMRLRASTYDAAWLTQLEVDRWRGNASLRELGEALRAGVGPDDAMVPAGFDGELRDYQKVGVAWMQLLHRTGCGGVLADDMGLGKTVQVLVHVLSERDAGRLDRPCLVVAPVSVLGTWAQQSATFTPQLRVGMAHGPDRAETVDRLEDFDIVLTSYATLLRDDGLRDAAYHLVALDEAQAIKNPRAKIAQATRALRARQRLALTGTPVENNLLELWSIFRFVAPGLLGSQAQFNRAYARPVERSGDVDAGAGLRRRTAPFLLRRTKDAVLSELPPKTEVVRTVVLTEEERELYETVRRAVSDDVREALRRKGLSLSRIVVLEALLRLRQICCDARLAPVEPPEPRTTSAKLDELLALLEPLLASGHRVLVFSQFTSMLDLIAQRLNASGQPHLMLTGKTRNRQALVDRFQAHEVPLFLVSLKAGGTGLNLTAADTVILYDPWWNPAVEQQAIDRTHRIGQERPVTVYRLVCEGSVEERILALQAHKRELAQTVHGSTGADRPTRGGFALDEEDVETLLAPLERR